MKKIFLAFRDILFGKKRLQNEISDELKRVFENFSITLNAYTQNVVFPIAGRYMIIILMCLFATRAYALTSAEIFKKHADSVVTIYVQDRNGAERSGSGFFVDKNGLILTNFHVISGAKDIRVTLKNGKVWPVLQLIAQDPGIDLALIKINAVNAPIRLAQKLPAIGSEVTVIGAPLGFSHSMSDGILSSIRGTSGEFIQITAPISPGSSGSPIFDEKGNAIGIATLFFQGGQNMNFAPSVAAMRDFIHKRPMIATRENPTVTEQKIRFIEIINDENDLVYVDTSSIENRGNYIVAWEKWIPRGESLKAYSRYNTPIGYTMRFYAHSLNGKQSQLLQSVIYDAKGMIINNQSWPFNPYQYSEIIPGSKGEMLYNVVMHLYSSQRN